MEYHDAVAHAHSGIFTELSLISVLTASMNVTAILHLSIQDSFDTGLQAAAAQRHEPETDRAEHGHDAVLPLHARSWSCRHTPRMLFATSAGSQALLGTAKAQEDECTSSPRGAHLWGAQDALHVEACSYPAWRWPQHCS